MFIFWTWWCQYFQYRFMLVIVFLRKSLFCFSNCLKQATPNGEEVNMFLSKYCWSFSFSYLFHTFINTSKKQEATEEEVTIFLSNILLIFFSHIYFTRSVPHQKHFVLCKDKLIDNRGILRLVQFDDHNKTYYFCIPPMALSLR